MASPDFQQYINLTINDVQPPDIYEAALDYASTTLPEFSPRQGTVEDALLQAMSLISGIMTGAINRLPNGLMEGVLRLIGFIRNESTFATGAVIFEAIDSNGANIPTGTQIAFTENVDGVIVQHVFLTTADAVIEVGQSFSADVPVIAALPGEKPFIADQSSMTILIASNRLFSCAFSGVLAQGEAGESDQDYFTRGSAYLASLSDALVTTSQINNFVLLEFPQARRALTIDNAKFPGLPGVEIFESSGSLQASCVFDPLSFFAVEDLVGEAVRVVYAEDPKFNKVYEVTNFDSTDKTIFFSNTAGASSGEIYDGGFEIELLKNMLFDAPAIGGATSTVVSGAAGSDLSQTDIVSIEQLITQKVIAGLTFDATNAFIVPVNIQIDIKALPSFDQIDIKNSVIEVITAFVSPDEFEFSDRLRVNSILSRASQVFGVDYVESVEMVIGGSELQAEIDANGDVVFFFKGTLPLSTVSVDVI